MARALSRHRRLRIALLALVVSVPLLAGGWAWLRHSSFVAVRHVHVIGARGPEAQAIEAALDGAARHMSTLDVSIAALRAAVAPFPVVSGVHASASLPHGLSIRVTEQLPVAALVAAAGTRTAVAADGVVLGQALLSSSLPSVTGGSAPSTGARVGDAGVLGALAVLGAAPAQLAKVVSRAFTGPYGLTLAMRNGLLAYFGDATRPHAKWLSLARVLADPSSAGASYVDVRVPEHPAAGFPAGSGPPASASSAASGTAAGSAPTSGAGSESTIAAIAARLAPPPGSEPSSGREAATSSEPQSTTGTGEPGSTTSTESASAPPGEAAREGAQAGSEKH